MRPGAWPLRCRRSTQNALPSLLCLRGSVGNAAARVALPGSLGNTMVSVAFIGGKQRCCVCNPRWPKPKPRTHPELSDRRPPSGGAGRQSLCTTGMRRVCSMLLARPGCRDSRCVCHRPPETGVPPKQTRLCTEESGQAHGLEPRWRQRVSTATVAWAAFRTCLVWSGFVTPAGAT